MGRIAVMGAGAVGCYYGAMLAQAGEEVVLIGRPALASAVAGQGLIIDRATGREVVHLPVATDPGAIAGAELVLFCVKSQDTEAAGRQIAPHLAPDAVVLSLQNGVGNAERLAAILGRPVIPAVVYVAVGMTAAGHLRHHGRGDLVLGDAPQSAALATWFAAAGIPTEVSAGAETALWVKLTINCAWNAISALTQQPYGRILAAPGAEGVVSGLVAECRAVAAASGITLPEGLEDDVRRIAETMAGQMSSTAQDMARGRATEIGFLNGEIVRRAGLLGIPVPLNAAMTVLVQLAEAPAV
ncbi:ketopantoate reductase family protein [Gemmobacter sp. LW-1]|uniref:ketopantoate reductase family protein n=1 Tax=Gemmobacter sp. LW-1 TaxID=1529005 RepID=UPI0006C76440|nr:ketopantoate reductase family protein [Gemmobacter sp. LW-1]